MDWKNDRYIGMLVVIDILTKYATCVPTRNKKPAEILNAIRNAAVKMLGNPKTYYTDDEGSLNSKIVQKYFSDNNIRHLITRTHAGVVERVIRTLKADIYKRVENDPSKTWDEYLPQVLTKYNYKDIHSAIKMTPEQATKKSNHFNVHLQLLAHKRMDRIQSP